MAPYTYKTETAQAVADLTDYAVANLAAGACSNAEAAAFYGSVRDSLAEAIDYADGGRPDEDRLSEIADGAPDVYNYTRMMEAIGTGAYLDSSEFATGGEDMVTLAGYVLYELASRTVAAILEEVGL